MSSAPFVDSSNGFIGTPNIPFLTTGAVQVRTWSFGYEDGRSSKDFEQTFLNLLSDMFVQMFFSRAGECRRSF